MKVRIKFQKYGAMKFIGHLDVMRYFQKAFRRAGVDNEYTKGFSPHQIMSFAAPLGVGLTSDGEYLDVQLLSCDAPEIMINRINAVLTEGFHITGFQMLKEREENKKKVTAMALVSSADYLVSLKDGYPVDDRIHTPELFRKELEAFLNQAQIIVDKKTKTQEKAVDIKPMITLAAFDEAEYEDKLRSTLNTDYMSAWLNENNEALGVDQEKISDPIKTILINRGESVADVYENNIKVYLQLHTGSSANLKPELVMEEFCNHLGIEFQSFAWQVHRLETYTREEESGTLIPLDMLER